MTRGYDGVSDGGPFQKEVLGSIGNHYSDVQSVIVQGTTIQPELTMLFYQRLQSISWPLTANCWQLLTIYDFWLLTNELRTMSWLTRTDSTDWGYWLLSEHLLQTSDESAARKNCVRSSDPHVKREILVGNVILQTGNHGTSFDIPIFQGQKGAL